MTTNADSRVPSKSTNAFQRAYSQGRTNASASMSMSFNVGCSEPVQPGTGKTGVLHQSSRSGTQSLFRTEVDDDHQNALPKMPHQTDRLRKINPKASSLAAVVDPNVKTGSLAWVESDTFQMLSGLIIFGNAIVIGLETDMAEFWAWFWVEQALLVFFVFELTIRLCRFGGMYFKHEEDYVWNFLDFGIVMSGVVDQWGMPVVEYFDKPSEKKSHVGVVFMLMRMLRLLRIVRLFRLVKIVRPLFQLAQGVLEAMQGMFWVLVFMVMTLYATAILCTRFIGHGVVFPDDMADDEELVPIRKMFATVPQSMFTLFGTMTSWSLLKFVPLFRPFPILQPLFVLFYIYSAWALLAVMTGVVSENLIAIRDQMVQDNEAKEEKRKQNITNTLFDLFAKADADGSGSVSRAEFNDLLQDPTLMKLLVKNSNLRVQDLHDLFDWLDHDGGGTITIDEFMNGFKWVNDPLSAKSIVKLQERLVADVGDMKVGTTEQIDTRFRQVMEVCSHPIRKVHAISEQMDNLDDICSSLKVGLKEDKENMPTMRELSVMELNLHSKLDMAFDRINRVSEAINLS